MTHLLDTNVLIAHLRAVAASTLLDRVARAGRSNVVTCSVVGAELLTGAAKSSNPAENAGKVEALLALFDSLPFDDAAADEYAVIRAKLEANGRPIGANDLLIAAIASAHHLTVVTHNVNEFSRIPNLKVEAW